MDIEDDANRQKVTRDKRREEIVPQKETSAEMRALNKVFSRNHAMCIHLNLLSMGAMLFYGWRLALRMV